MDGQRARGFNVRSARRLARPRRSPPLPSSVLWFRPWVSNVRAATGLVGLIFPPFLLGLCIYGIYDGYKGARRWNAAMGS